MKNIGKLKLYRQEPVILCSNETMEEIRAIVKQAPKEVQWFYRVKRVESKGQLGFLISDLFVPEQYCSTAEVETKGYQQVAFYKELKETYDGDIEKINEVLQTLSCWCHSHGNLGSPSPSGTDKQTFDDLIETFSDEDVPPVPVLMLIFTKNDTYYSAVFDPKSGLSFENVEIVTFGIDTSYVKEILDKKIKEPPKSKAVVWNQSNTPPGMRSSMPPSFSTNTGYLGNSGKDSSQEREEVSGSSWEGITKQFETRLQNLISRTESVGVTEAADAATMILQMIGEQRASITSVLLSGTSNDIETLKTASGLKHTLDNWESNCTSLYEELIWSCHEYDDVLDAVMIAEDILSTKTEDYEARKKLVNHWLETTTTEDSKEDSK
jgi:hypothetical protein